MSRAILLSTAFLAAVTSLVSVSAQTNANEGGRLQQSEALHAKGESLFAEGNFVAAADSYREATLLRCTPRD